ncbi:hypothetical protein B296_00014956 [Ensete ventricosum]|uniref:Uncharacterized protein n=1 Tax=Ensete ventricosum TaxID=4639 RepID=A0A426Z7D9_ENSVE|nr:hypothetical protein B296_00014956 [Ensete ventricosum]
MLALRFPNKRYGPALSAIVVNSRGLGRLDPCSSVWHRVSSTEIVPGRQRQAPTFSVSDGVKRTRTSPSMRPAVEKPRRRDVSDESRGRRWRPGLDGRREDGARETPE